MDTQASTTGSSSSSPPSVGAGSSSGSLHKLNPSASAFSPSPRSVSPAQTQGVSSGYAHQQQQSNQLLLRGGRAIGRGGRGGPRGRPFGHGGWQQHGAPVSSPGVMAGSANGTFSDRSDNIRVQAPEHMQQGGDGSGISESGPSQLPATPAPGPGGLPIGRGFGRGRGRGRGGIWGGGYVRPEPEKRERLSASELEEKMARMKLVNAEVEKEQQARDADARLYAERIASERSAASSNDAPAAPARGDTKPADQGKSMAGDAAAKSSGPTPSVRRAQLFGGAIEVDVPANYKDASELRQIPDTQQVFLSPSSDTSLIIEALERVAADTPAEAIKLHFEALAHDNDASDEHVVEVSAPERFSAIAPDAVSALTALPTPEPATLIGRQNVCKFNKQDVDQVLVCVALYRVDVGRRRADVVMSVNVNLSAADEDAEVVQKWFDAAAKGLRIIDFGLFVEK